MNEEEGVNVMGYRFTLIRAIGLKLLIVCLVALSVWPPSPASAEEAPVLAAPTNLAVVAKSDRAISLSWTASTSNYINEYEIREGSRTVAVVSRPTVQNALPTVYAFTGLEPSTAYSFTVIAKDGYGNVSPPSAPLAVTTVPGSSSVNMALGHRVVATYQDGDRPAWKVTDGTVNTVSGVRNIWHSANANQPHWIMVDLERPRYAGKFVLKHMGITGASTDNNTRDYIVQGSNTAIQWSDLVTVTGNTYNVTEHPVSPGEAYRFYRVYITNPGLADFRARLSEFEIYSDPTRQDPAYTVPEEINVSADLVSLGLYGSNLAPNQPAVDARPYVEAAVNYANLVGLKRIVFDPGSYYFLSKAASDRHLDIVGAKDLTVDFGGSDLYFQYSHLIAIQLTDCVRTELRNAKIDYLNLPSTQVQVNNVNASGRTIGYTALPGWSSPASFNTPRSPYGDSGAIRMFVFRNGERVQEVGRLQATRTTTGTTITVVDDNKPWTREANLAAIQPGDTIVYTDRSGGHTIKVVGGEGTTLRHIEVYAAPVFAILFHKQRNSVVDDVYVRPRPGTERLMSSNADGIHMGGALDNNAVRNSYVRGTGDDGIAFNSTWLATVTGQTYTRTLTVQRYLNERFADGQPVAFMDGATGDLLGNAVVVQQNPAYNQQTSAAGESVTLTFDRDLPVVPAGSGMYSSAPVQRGSGALVKNNVVEETNLARGILFAGIVNGTIEGNTVRRTNMSGINVNQEYLLSTFKAAPASQITIKDNTIERSFLWGVPGTELVNGGAALLVNSYTPNGWSPGMPHRDIRVTGNTVNESGRTGIRMENVLGGEVTGNSIDRYALLTEQVFGIRGTAGDIERMQSEIRQPIVVRTSGGITVSSNTYAPAVTHTELIFTPAEPDGATGQYMVPVTISFTAAEPLPNVVRFEYSLDGGGTWLTYGEPLTFEQSGTYALSYRAVNSAGHTETPRTANFSLQLTP
jgi:chitodextrinase